jgi:hypothetical protein
VGTSNPTPGEQPAAQQPSATELGQEPSGSDATADAQQAPTPAQPQEQAQAGEQIETEIVALRPAGFEPAEISRPKGEFNLVVQNLTGLDEVNIRLDRENGGGRLHEVRLPLSKRNWRQSLDLPPGTYVLTEADHPNWVMRLNITSH